MSKKKKIILVVVILVLLVGMISAALLYRRNHSKAYVQSIMDINSSWVLQNSSQDGNISDAATQNVYLEQTDLVQKVYVTQGAQVAVGDPLFEYDTRQLELDVEAKNIQVESQTNQLNTAKQQLSGYEKIVPVAESQPSGVTLTDQQCLPSPYQGDGTAAAPYCYLCTENTIVTAEQINGWIAAGELVILEMREGNIPQGALVSSWTIDGNQFLPVEDGSYWNAATREPWYPQVAEEKKTYTQAEKDALISDKKIEIRKLETSIKLAVNAADQSKQKLTDATVRATVPGVVKTIGDPANPPKDGSPFVSIVSEQGVSLVGHISEMDLETVKVGDQVTVQSWESGSVTNATITEIDDYPAENYQTYTETNPNVSYYEYRAYLEDANGFYIGENVSITPFVEDMENVIILDKIYVKTEKGKSFVYKKSEKGTLVKQEVQIRSTAASGYLEITDGLTQEDYIAYPYGSKAKEGIQTTEEAPFSLF